MSRARSRLALSGLSALGLVVAGFVAQRIGERRFEGRAREEARALIGAARGGGPVVSAEDFAGVPGPVRRYFRYAGIEGKRRPRLVRVEHGGTFLVGSRWIPVTGEYHFSVDPPAFVWRATMRAAPGVRIGVLDRYRGGRGGVLAKAFYLLTLASGEGREMDEGSLMRYLAEIALVPTALLPSERLRWEGIDADSARATVRDGELEASMVFRFGPEGGISGVSAERYMMTGNGYSRERWTGRCGGYREMDGVMVPTVFEAVWNLADGDLPYARFEIADVRYDGAE